MCVLPAAFSMMPACAMRMGAYETLKGFFLQGPLHNKLSPGALVFLASAMTLSPPRLSIACST